MTLFEPFFSAAPDADGADGPGSGHCPACGHGTGWLGPKRALSFWTGKPNGCGGSDYVCRACKAPLRARQTGLSQIVYVAFFLCLAGRPWLKWMNVPDALLNAPLAGVVLLLIVVMAVLGARGKMWRVWLVKPHAASST